MNERQIEVEADSLDEAKKQLQSDLPKGCAILSEEILCKGELETVEGVAATVEEAVEIAKRKIPESATIAEEVVQTTPKRETTQVEAENGQNAASAAPLKYAAKVELVSLNTPGKKGFLGFGKTPAIYDVTILQQAVVKVVFRQKAKIRAKTVSESQLIQIRSEFANLHHKLRDEKVSRIPNDGNAMYALGYAFAKAETEAREAIMAKYALTDEDLKRIL